VSEEQELELESRLHALLVGALDDADRREVLREVVANEAVRARLAEMIECQQQARRAVGCEGADAEMRAAMARTLARLSAGGAPDEGAGRGVARPRYRRRGALGRWAAAAAAVALVAAGVLLLAYRGSPPLQESAREVRGAIPMPGPTAGEMVAYRRLWRRVRDPHSDESPWVLLGEERSEFGYLAGAAGTGHHERLLLVRCWVVSVDGRRLGQVNLLLPADRAVRLSLPEAGRLDGRVLGCDVATGRQWATVGLQVGDAPVETVRISGRAKVGVGPVELGRFQLEDRPLRVLLDVVPLDGSVS
jgi:hypothetical protein